jgi:hypothetical protein
MPNFAFFRGPKYFSYFYSLLLIYSIGKRFKWKKSLWAVFSVVGPALHRSRPISAHEPACQPITVPPSLTDGARLLALSSPQIVPHLLTRMAMPAKL